MVYSGGTPLQACHHLFTFQRTPIYRGITDGGTAECGSDDWPGSSAPGCSGMLWTLLELARGGGMTVAAGGTP